MAVGALRYNPRILLQTGEKEKGAKMLETTGTWTKLGYALMEVT